MSRQVQENDSALDERLRRGPFRERRGPSVERMRAIHNQVADESAINKRAKRLLTIIGAAAASVILFLSISFLFEMPGGLSDQRLSTTSGLKETIPIPLGRTPEEAVEKFRRSQMGRVIHKESVDGGMLLFYKKENKPETSSLQLEYVRKTWFGWKWGTGGGYGISFGAVQDASQQMAASFMAMPYLKGSLTVPFPILFGELLDDSVQQVTVAVENGDVEQQATVIREGLETPIWFAALPRTAAVPYRIELYDREGTMTGSKTVSNPTDYGHVTLRKDDYKDWALSPLFDVEGKSSY